MFKIDLMGLFNKVVAAVFSVMLLFITLALIIGVVNLFLKLGDLAISKELARDYLHIISDVLTLFVLIELLRSIVEYFNTHRLRMTFIVDAGIVFVLRDIMIRLFEHTMQPDQLYALSALLFVMTVLRIGSVVVNQREKSAEAARGEKDAVTT